MAVTPIDNASRAAASVAGGAVARVGQSPVSPSALAAVIQAAESALLDIDLTSPHPQTAASTPTTPAQAVGQAAQTSVVRQDGLAPLLADLAQALESDGLPAPVRQAALQVLIQARPLTPQVTGEDVRQALGASGLLLEAGLAQPQTRGAAPSDLKANLLVLRQTLATTTEAPAAQAPVPPPRGESPQPPLPVAATEGEAPAEPRAPVTSPPVSTSPQAAAEAPQSTQSAPPAPATPAASPAAESEAAPAQAGPAQAAPLQAAASPAGTTTPALPGGPVVSAPAERVGVAIPGESARPATASDVQAKPPALPQEPDLAAFQALRDSPPPTRQAAPREDPAISLLNDSLETPASQSVAAARQYQPKGDDAPAAHLQSQGPPRPPPPYRGGPIVGQPAASPSPEASVAGAARHEHLVQGTDAALARIELMQIASLPQPQQHQDVNAASRWVFEAPLQTPQGTAVAQFEVSRDGHGGSAGPDARPTWRARFGIDVEPLGPISAHLSLSGDRLTVGLWAERGEAYLALRDQIPELTRALTATEMEAEVAVHEGKPPAVATPAGRLLDTAV